MWRKQVVVLLTALLIMVGIGWTRHSTAGVEAQDVSSTPVQLHFATSTPTPPRETNTPTRTPTLSGRVMIEALSNETNVRAGPDINDDRLGTIDPGEQYPVVAKRFDWYQIQYPDSPNGMGWVYKEVVTLIGDAEAIPELSLEEIPTIDPAFVNAQEATSNAELTVQSMIETPGAVGTLTIEAMVTPTGVFTPGPDGAVPTLEPGAPLPTYTPPQFTNTPIILPKAAATSNTSSDGEIPPIIPILALGALGLMGLLISFLRRL